MSAPARSVVKLALVVAALLACKSQAKVTGSVSVNGAPFEVKECSAGHATSSFGGTSTTTSFVSLIDAAGNRIQISEAGHTVRVSYSTGGGAAFADVGEGCGTLTFTTPPVKSPADAAGNLAVDCNGSGYHVIARVSFADCGRYGV